MLFKWLFLNYRWRTKLFLEIRNISYTQSGISRLLWRHIFSFLLTSGEIEFRRKYIVNQLLQYTFCSSDKPRSAVQATHCISNDPGIYFSNFLLILGSFVVSGNSWDCYLVARNTHTQKHCKKKHGEKQTFLNYETRFFK